MPNFDLTRRASGLALVLCLGGAAALAQAQAEHQGRADAFVPFDGNVGYQELAISADTYYLAFHGSRETSGPWVNVAWGARAAELCQSKGMGLFVALRYIGEAVLPGDVAMAESGAAPGRLVPVAGAPVYVPLIVPGGPRYVRINAPGKVGAVRCLAVGAQPRDPARAVRVADALEAGRRFGVPVR